jgi:hypothetical protein
MTSFTPLAYLDTFCKFSAISEHFGGISQFGTPAFGNTGVHAPAAVIFAINRLPRLDIKTCDKTDKGQNE